MTLKIYDTLTRKKRPFEPVHEGEARMYVCGMTVQGKPHVGHMRAAVVADMIRRHLEFSGYKVTLVNNFTDIDDKIIAIADKEDVPYQEIARRNMEAYLDAVNRLGLVPATHYPRATEHIPEIVALIQKLVDKGIAYPSGGDVYYRVSKDHEYGKLSGRRPDELRAGARVEVGEAKEDPLDFTLWKGAKPGEPSWPSPWGPGRPGWHIECSAMAMAILGETFDLHGGGMDLLFPHHENEIAQSEAATGKPFARYWTHNGLVNLGGQKMSKSTLHFFLFEDVVREVDPAVIHFYLLSTHYRSPIEFNEDRLAEAGKGLGRLVETRDRVETILGPEGPRRPGSALASLRAGDSCELPEDLAAAGRIFLEAMDDDFNSARALGQLFDASRALNRLVDEGVSDSAGLSDGYRLLIDMLAVLGLRWPERRMDDIPQQIKELADLRWNAKTRRDWAEADRLRDEVALLGWAVLDTADSYALKPLIK